MYVLQVPKSVDSSRRSGKLAATGKLAAATAGCSTSECYTQACEVKQSVGTSSRGSRHHWVRPNSWAG